MHRRSAAGGALLCTFGLTLAACGSSSHHAAGSTSPGSTAPGSTAASNSASAGGGGNTTLTVEGNTLSGPITGGFNPFLNTSDTWTLGATSMVYEPLLQFNLLKPGSTTPWLASSYAFSSDGKTLTFHLHPGVKWSDGTPFTSADVIFTMNLLKSHPALNAYGVQFTGISAPDAATVVMNFSGPAYTQLYSIAGMTLIVPQHKWQSVANPSAYPDTQPVGTGPYVVKTLNAQGITLVKNPNYWQPGKPAIGTLQFPDYESNNSANAALESGELTWGGNFVSHIQQVFANTPSHQYFFPAVNTVSLFPNLTKWPTNNLAVRQAISLAIDRSQVAQEGEQGDEAPATSATGMILPNDAGFLTDPGANTLPTNLTQAAQVLQHAGFTKQHGVWTSPSGQQVAFALEDPASYSDYMSSIQAIAQQLNAFGMKVTVNGVSANAWNADIQSGNYQATLRWGQTAPDPYGQFENWLDPKLIGGGVGNFERYSGADATQYLDAYASAAGPAAQRQAAQELGNLVATQVPIIPIMYGASWGEYNTSKVKGWPSQANNYDPVQPAVPWDEYTVLQLHT